MKADFFILQICDFLDDGDGFYRLHEPSRRLARLPGVLVIDCHYYHRLLPELIEQADVIVLPFVHNWDFFPIIEDRRAAGRVTVFEANDYFYDVQPWSPIAAQWQERSIQDEYRCYMAISDAVQTSSNELARRWQPWARRVAVFQNHLPDAPPLHPPLQRPFTIGWGGSPGHFADWFAITPALQKWLDAHPDVRLAVMTNEYAKSFLQLPAQRYQFTPFGSLGDYLKFLPSLDVGLAPCLPTDYNRCRSDVKYLEYAAHGVAGIYADIEPYRESIVHEETGLLYKTEEEMLAHLDRLYRDADLRQRIRAQAHAQVTSRRMIADRIQERLDFYRQLLPGAPRGITPSDEMLKLAVRDGNYLQLRPGEAEKALIAAVQPPATPQSAQTLARLIDQFPTYHVARHQYGRVLNDLRDYRSAVSCLERANQLYARSAGAVCELGRARFCMGDSKRARADIEKALEINGFYLPGWQYLLRLLALTRASDGPAWAEKAHQRFPRNYQLALAGAALYPPDEALAIIDQHLRRYAETFKPDELVSAASGFSRTLLETCGSVLGTARGLEVLSRCCEVFPRSARLADLYGRALQLSGRPAEARREYLRALEIRRAAQTYQAEFAKEDGSIHYWQFAEHIEKWQPSEKS